MKTNPGGQLSPDQIVGRDELIASMWATLEGQSIYMNDLRRIGKTQIMVKMHAEPPTQWVTVKCDLGGMHSAAEFATQAYRDSLKVLDTKQKVLRTMGNLLGSLKGAEIAGILKLPDGSSAPWKEVLRRTFSDIEEAMIQLGPNHRMLFLWDEVPFLLENIARSENAGVAMEVLDVLRALGQDHDRIRLLLTGSIGLHHILAELQKQGYNGTPLNRMEHVQPGPLEAANGIALAESLFGGLAVPCADPQGCAVELAEAVGHVPFYIHKLISRLPKGGVTSASIQALLDREITSDNNDWDLEHYRKRLGRYYGPDEKLALQILDAIAIGESSGKLLSFQAMRKLLSAKGPVNEETLRALLKLLCQDHYLIRTTANEYRFYLTLIRRWWCLDRNL
ncbi:MAG: hypothetical protein V4599_02635 [Verrucomicrobiota bacterium]